MSSFFVFVPHHELSIIGFLTYKMQKEEIVGRGNTASLVTTSNLDLLFRYRRFSFQHRI